MISQLFLFSSLIFLCSCQIQLKDVNVITLQKGAYTAGRRSQSIPQLNCVGGTAKSQANRVNTVQCYNKGFNGRDYDWECKSQLDDTLRLGRSSVSCEGYSYPNDPYILVGSCGLEYELEYTDKYYSGQKSGSTKQQTTTTTHIHSGVPVVTTEDDVIVLFILVLMVIVVILAFVTDCFTRSPQPSRKTVVVTEQIPDPRLRKRTTRQRTVENDNNIGPIIKEKETVIIENTSRPITKETVIIDNTPTYVPPPVIIDNRPLCIPPPTIIDTRPPHIAVPIPLIVPYTTTVTTTNTTSGTTDTPSDNTSTTYAPTKRR